MAKRTVTVEHPGHEGEKVEIHGKQKAQVGVRIIGGSGAEHGKPVTIRTPRGDK